MATTPVRSTQQPQVLGGVDREKTSAGAKVTVACNIPNGIRIRAYRMIPGTEPILGGGVRKTELAEAVTEGILIKGPGHEIDKMPRAPIVGKTDQLLGYAITSGVDKDIWDNWYEYNKDSALIRNRCVFAFEKRADTIAAARDNADTRSGLEPFAQENDPRRPRTRSELTDIKPDEEQRERRKHEVLADDLADIEVTGSVQGE